MKLEIFKKEGNKKELIRTEEDHALVLQNLLYYSYQVAVVKQKNIKVKYQYNYNDSQVVTFIDKDMDGIRDYYYVISGIDTKMGYLDTYKIMEGVK